jgi:hypothetical protein
VHHFLYQAGALLGISALKNVEELPHANLAKSILLGLTIDIGTVQQRTNLKDSHSNAENIGLIPMQMTANGISVLMAFIALLGGCIVPQVHRNRRSLSFSQGVGCMDWPGHENCDIILA